MMGVSFRAAGKKTRDSVLAAILFTVSPLPLLASQQATIAWNPSVQPGVVGYRIYYGPASGNYTNVLVVGNVTNALVSGLREGASYYFAATAYDLLGLESGYSNEAAFTVPSAYALAIRNQTPTMISVTASGAVPNRWALQTSVDMAGWNTLARGTNSPVNVSLPVSGGPKQFFRLKAE